MSDEVRVHVVCEGPTDTVVLESALTVALNKPLIVTQIQPESDALNDLGPRGGGWKGVRAWCRQSQANFGRIADSPSLLQADLLVVHVDADIAADPEIDCEQPCPPVDPIVEYLKTTLLGWMGEEVCPQGVLFWIPSKATESWVFAGLYPGELDDMDIECVPDPAALLHSKPEKLVRTKQGRLRKNVEKYRDVSERLVRNWQHIIHACSGAAQFHDELEQAIHLNG